MQYLIRNNKVEYSGNKKEIIAYIMQAYEDDYFVQEYSTNLYKDPNALKQTLIGLGLSISNTIPKRKKRSN